jgi:hypothetical protein
MSTSASTLHADDPMPLNEEIIVVSGLPRSGTSLMMQMLHRGGIEVVTDELRPADDDNPRGYFEFEAVKRTKQDSTWVTTARGKAVKLVSSLLYDLPTSESYRVLFMQRDIDEVLESQEKMLQRLGRPAVPREQIRASFGVHLDRLYRWLPQQSHLRTLMLSYNRLLSDPSAEIPAIVNFLDDRPNLDQMLAAIDPALYRNRSTTTHAPLPSA